MLTDNEPDVDFTLALGADTFIDLASGKWRRTKDVFSSVGHRMVVFRRITDDSDSNDADSKTDRLVQESIAKWQSTGSSQSSLRVIQIPTLGKVSSSAVRRSTDATTLKEMLASGVLEYIQRRRMYSLSENAME